MLELQRAGEGARYAFAAMDAFTDDVAKLGVPSDVTFQQPVANLMVRSNVEGVANGDKLSGGNIEFWPHNYGPANAAKVPGASDAEYDFGDLMAEPPVGYGSMQIHNGGAGQTVIAVNNWRTGAGADLGMGNQSGPNKDWTFASNAASFSCKRLRVLVHLVR